MSAEQKRANAIGLYMEAIRDGKAEQALKAYTGERYTQHSTGVADGKAGFLEFFLPFLERNPVRDMQVVRAIVDGPYVALHVYQNLNNGQYRYVTSDMFDTNADDKIIEHWDVIEEEVRDFAPGVTMMDGSSQIKDLDQTEANRAQVIDYINTVLIGGGEAGKYLVQTGLIEHSPAPVQPGSYTKAHKIVVEGNFACVLSAVTIDTAPWCIMDWLRFEDGKIAEHWDVREKILPEDQWNNSGKF